MPVYWYSCILSPNCIMFIIFHSQVYEEQGYEDAGYDHGGSARHKEENERLLENDGKDSAPNHLEDDEQAIQEDEEHEGQPSEEKRESNHRTETLSQMNSDASHRRMRPNRNDDDKDTGDKGEGRTNRDQNKLVNYLNKNRKKSKKQSSKDWEIILRSEKRNKNHASVKETGKKTKQRADRRVSSDKEDHKPGKSRDLIFDAEKYPFYNKLNSNKYTKNSALKYALNPREIPVKVPHQMSFYDSRKLQCDDVTGPVVDVPDGEEKSPDNSELKNPNRGKPRMGKLGESIDCLKRKFFGHDPLDNPFFKETHDA